MKVYESQVHRSHPGAVHIYIGEFFTNSLQYNNANIANFVLALPFKIKKTNEDYNLET